MTASHTLSDIDAAKARLRRRALAARARLDPGRRMAAAWRVAEIGLDFLAPEKGAIVSGYHPIDEEFDPLPLLQRLDREGHPIGLPVTPKRRDRLTFRRWRPGEALERGVFGVAVPPADAEVVEPDIVLAPMLAFDRSGFRLGYGAGYYDRTLAALRAQGAVVAVGLAYDEQAVERVPRDGYDQRLDWLLTPSGPVRIEG